MSLEQKRTNEQEIKRPDISETPLILEERNGNIFIGAAQDRWCNEERRSSIVRASVSIEYKNEKEIIGIVFEQHKQFTKPAHIPDQQINSDITTRRWLIPYKLSPLGTIGG